MAEKRRILRVENVGIDARAEDTVLHDGKRYCALRSEGAFHLRLMRGADDSWALHAYKAHGELYRPIHPSMTAEDIEGATYAYDDGKYWLFAHCSPAEQVDFAARAEAFAFAQFAEAIQRSNAEGIRSGTNQGRNTAHAKSEALLTFARRVGQRVHKTVVGHTLGYYHRIPHHDHKRELAVAAIKTELQVLRQNQEADADSRAMLGRVTVAANAIVARLTSSHTVEWRHERAQRLQLEAIKKAIRGADPIDDHEYIFTAGKTADAPTAAADLPLASWALDAAGSGTVRGDYTYYDGYPLTLGPDRPYVLAFKRATGVAEWSFVKAVKIYGGRES